jgi:hypothetical protein
MVVVATVGSLRNHLILIKSYVRLRTSTKWDPLETKPKSVACIAPSFVLSGLCSQRTSSGQKPASLVIAYVCQMAEWQSIKPQPTAHVSDK